MKVGHWVLGKTLGEGTFGKVKLGIHLLTGERVAVKVLEKDRITDRGDVKRVTREIQILKHMQHPHIVNLLEVVERPRHIYLVTEYVAGGELFEFIVAHGRLQEGQACRIFRQVLVAVDACHAYGVAHRDLKPENVLIDENCNVKLIDFGLSNTFEGPAALLRTACGSPCYAAPEMIAGKRYKGSCADLWSLGVCLFAMLCGYLPFEDPDTPALYKKILAGAYQVADHVSSDARDLLAGMLTTEPTRRFTVADIYAHPWFVKRCADPLEPPLTLHPERLASMTSVSIDPDILGQLEQLGISRDYCVQCLTDRKRNHTTAAYFLLKERAQRALRELHKHARPGTHSAHAHAAAAGGQPLVAPVPAKAAPVAQAAPHSGRPASRDSASEQENQHASNVQPPPGAGAWTSRIAGAPPAQPGGAAAVAPPENEQNAVSPRLVPGAPKHGGAGAMQPHPPHVPRPPSDRPESTSRPSQMVGGAPPRRPHPRSKRYMEGAANAPQPMPHGAAAAHAAYGGVGAIGTGGALPGRPTTAGPVAGGAGRFGSTHPGAGGTQDVRMVEVTKLVPPGRAVGTAHPRSAAGVRPSTVRGGAPTSSAAYTVQPRRPMTARDPTAGRRTAGRVDSGLNSTGEAPIPAPMSAPSPLPPRQLMAEAVRQLERHKVGLLMQTPFIAKCERHGLSFLAEVAATDATQKWFVVRLQLQKGDANLFREIANRLLPSLVQ